MFDQGTDDSEEPHDYGEERSLHRGGGGGRGHSLSVLQARGEELYDQWAHLLFQLEAEFFMLQK